VQDARRWLQEASSIVALTGAGISAESGEPTFRGADGLWNQFRAEDLATPEAFVRDPRLVWEWYDWRRSLIACAEPNPGHRALAELERRKDAFTVVTQNIDGLHDRAGSQRICKLHGDIWSVRCTGCGKRRHDARVPLPELPPHCECGALLRPDVVWFGEPLPAEIWQQAEQAIFEAEVLLVVGTSAVVHPAADLVWLARSRGARVIEVNLGQTALSSQVDRSLRGKAGEILPQLII